MTKIKAILIDDEQKALSSLHLKVQKYFPDIDVIATCTNSEEGINSINDNKPDLVFLDIEMPVFSGFDVLAKIDNPNFEIIFVTAYDNYAIEAIKNCAIGYIVKPIDNDELKQAINNALNSIKQKTALANNQNLLDQLAANKSLSSVSIPTTQGLIFQKVATIIRFEGVDGYTKIICNDHKPILSSYSIGRFVKMLEGAPFFLVHKSHFINLNYVTGVLKEGTVLLQDNSNIPLSKTKRSALIAAMEQL